MKRTLSLIIAALVQFSATYGWAARLDGPHLTPGSVTEGRLADLSVSSAKLQPGSVTADKIDASGDGITVSSVTTTGDILLGGGNINTTGPFSIIESGLEIFQIKSGGDARITGDLCLGSGGSSTACLNPNGTVLEIYRGVGGGDSSILFNHTDSTWTVGVDNGATYWAIDEGTAFTATPKFVVAAGGKVGINDTNPAARFEVRSTIEDDFLVKVSSVNDVLLYSIDRTGKVRSEVEFNAAQRFVAGTGMVVSTMTPTQLLMETGGTGDNIFARYNQRSGYAAGGGNWVQLTQSPLIAQNFRYGFDFDSNSFQIRNTDDIPLFELDASGDLQVGIPGAVSTFTVAGALRIPSTFSISTTTLFSHQMAIDGKSGSGFIALLRDASVANRRNWSIAGGCAVDGSFCIRNSNAAGGDPNANTRFFISRTGNIGIGGQTNPLELIHIGDGTARAAIRIDGDGASGFGSGIDFYQDSVLQGSIGVTNHFSGESGTDLELRTGVGGGNDIVLQPDRNVGIGTGVSPAAQLEVLLDEEDAFALRISSQNGTATMVVNKLGDIGFGTSTPGQNVVGGTADFTDMVFHLKDTAIPVRLIAEGNGTSLELLDVGGTADVKILSLDVNGGVGKFFSRNDDLTTNADNILVMDIATGRIGLNEVVPAARLEVKADVSDAFALHVSSQNGAPIFSVDRLGQIEVGVTAVTNGIFFSNSGQYWNMDANNTASNDVFVWGRDRQGTSGGTELMRLTHAGNLGLLNSAPTENLEIGDGTLSVTMVMDGDGASGLGASIQFESDNVDIGSLGAYNGTHAGGLTDMELRSNGAGNDILLAPDTTNGQNVGVGDLTDPSALLEIEARVGDAFVLQVSSQNGTAMLSVDREGVVGGGTNLSGEFNITASTIANLSLTLDARNGSWRYTRLGNQVTVFGQIDMTATAAADTNTEMQISLPIASALAAAVDLSGTCVPFGTTSRGIRIDADITNDTASLEWRADTTAAIAYSCSFMYEVK